MTPDELRAQLARLQLSQTDLARVLHVTPRSVRRWIAGEARIKYSTATVVRRLQPTDREVNMARRLTM